MFCEPVNLAQLLAVAFAINREDKNVKEQINGSKSYKYFACLLHEFVIQSAMLLANAQTHGISP